MRINITSRIMGKMILFHLQSMNIPKARTAGISARIPGSTEFAVFLDFDNIEDYGFREELIYLQELHNLGDFHVFYTNEFGRHAVCIDRLFLREALAVVYSST